MSASTSLKWSGNAAASPAMMGFICILFVVLYRVMSRDGDHLGEMAVLALALVVLSAFLIVRVEIDEVGVVVRLGLIGFPKLVRDLQSIDEARSLRVQPLRYGGWGYRHIRGGWAVMVRGGEALELRTTGGRRLVVTVDDAEAAARCINDLASERNRRTI